MQVFRCVAPEIDPIQPQHQDHLLKRAELLRSKDWEKWCWDNIASSIKKSIYKMEEEYFLDLDPSFSGLGIWVFNWKPDKGSQAMLLNHLERGLTGQETRKMFGWIIELPENVLVSKDGNNPYLKNKITLGDNCKRSDQSYISQEDYVSKVLSVSRYPELDIEIYNGLDEHYCDPNP